jgi:hypothetical protein
MKFKINKLSFIQYFFNLQQLDYLLSFQLQLGKYSSLSCFAIFWSFAMSFVFEIQGNQ